MELDTFHCLFLCEICFSELLGQKSGSRWLSNSMELTPSAVRIQKAGGFCLLPDSVLALLLSESSPLLALFLMYLFGCTGS